MKSTKLFFYYFAVIFMTFNVYQIQAIQNSDRNSNLMLSQLEQKLIKQQMKDELDLKKLQGQLNLIEGFFHSQIHTNQNNPTHPQIQNMFVKSNMNNNNSVIAKKNGNNIQQQNMRKNQISRHIQNRLQVKQKDNNATNFQTNHNSTNTFSTPQYIGPRGTLCISSDDCNQKNQQFYSYIKLRLLGDNGVNGEQGPVGQQGQQGLQGLQGVSGQDGIQPSDQYFYNLTVAIAQDELLKSAQGGYVEFNKINNDYILEQIYFSGTNNCAKQRQNYFSQCNADLYPNISIINSTSQGCPSQQCVTAVDNMFCCFNSIPMSLQQINFFDTVMNSTWFPTLKQIDYQQGQLILEGQYSGNTILQSYKDRLQICSVQGFLTNNMQCPLNQQQGSSSNINGGGNSNQENQNYNINNQTNVINNNSSDINNGNHNQNSSRTINSGQNGTVINSETQNYDLINQQIQQQILAQGNSSNINIQNSTRLNSKVSEKKKEERKYVSVEIQDQ